MDGSYPGFRTYAMYSCTSFQTELGRVYMFMLAVVRIGVVQRSSRMQRRPCLFAVRREAVPTRLLDADRMRLAYAQFVKEESADLGLDPNIFIVRRECVLLGKSNSRIFSNRDS